MKTLSAFGFLFLVLFPGFSWAQFPFMLEGLVDKPPPDQVKYVSTPVTQVAWGFDSLHGSALSTVERSHTVHTKNGVLTGRLLVGDKPAAQVGVVALRSGNQNLGSAISDSNGHYQLRVPPGKLTIGAFANNRFACFSTFVVEDGKGTSLITQLAEHQNGITDLANFSKKVSVSYSGERPKFVSHKGELGTPEQHHVIYRDDNGKIHGRILGMDETGNRFSPQVQRVFLTDSTGKKVETLGLGDVFEAVVPPGRFTVTAQAYATSADYQSSNCNGYLTTGITVVDCPELKMPEPLLQFDAVYSDCGAAFGEVCINPQLLTEEEIPCDMKLAGMCGCAGGGWGGGGGMGGGGAGIGGGGAGLFALAGLAGLAVALDHDDFDPPIASPIAPTGGGYYKPPKVVKPNPPPIPNPVTPKFW